MRLALQRAVRAPGDRVRDRPGRLAQPGGARAARDRQHGNGDRGQPGAGHPAVAHHGVVVGQARRHRLHAGPHGGLAGALDHRPRPGRSAAGTAPPRPRAAPRRAPPSAARCTPRRSSAPSSDIANGTSYTATRRTGSPLAAASRASAPPDEMPYRRASPPTASISAARSSTSRSTAYGAVSAARAAAPAVVHDGLEALRERHGQRRQGAARRHRAAHQDHRGTPSGALVGDAGAVARKGLLVHAHADCRTARCSSVRRAVRQSSEHFHLVEAQVVLDLRDVRLGSGYAQTRSAASGSDQ